MDLAYGDPLIKTAFYPTFFNKRVDCGAKWGKMGICVELLF